MCLSAIGSVAATWRIKDLDIQGSLAKITYDEVDDRGMSTGRIYSVEKYITLKNPWIDIVYPNKEYGEVYIDDKSYYMYVPTGNSGCVVDNAGNHINTGMIEYKDVDYTWDVKAPFGIKSIRKAKLNINGVVQWFGKPEYNYPLSSTGRNAEVIVHNLSCGFSDFKVIGDNKIELLPGVDNYKPEYATYIDPSIIDKISSSDKTLSVDDFRAQKSKPTCKEFAHSADICIPISYEYAITGPSFDDDGNVIPFDKTVYSTTYENNLDDFAVEQLIYSVDDIVFGGVEKCDIEYTGMIFNEAKDVAYSYLTVNGVVMDGSYIGNYGGQDYWRPFLVTKIWTNINK